MSVSITEVSVEPDDHGSYHVTLRIDGAFYTFTFTPPDGIANERPQIPQDALGPVLKALGHRARFQSHVGMSRKMADTTGLDKPSTDDELQIK